MEDSVAKVTGDGGDGLRGGAGVTGNIGPEKRRRTE